MSTSIDPQPELPPNEELVAYLDGELSPDECRRIEERLAVDEAYRQQLRDLDQAWEALDALPAATVDDNFARTTIEMVTVAAQRDLSQHAVHAEAATRNRMWLRAAGGITAALATFAVARALLPDPNDRLIANLPVIQQFDMLSQIDDVNFLRRLPEIVAIEQLAHDQGELDREAQEIKLAAAQAPEARRQWIEALAPDEKAKLAAREKRLYDLARRRPQEEQRLRDLEQEISRDKNVDQLRKTMVAYNDWLALRSAGEQEDLRVLPIDKRLDQIRRIVRRENDEAARHLSADDAAKLRDEIDDIFEDRSDDFRKAMRRRDRDNRPFLEGPKPRLALMVIHWELNNDERDDRTSERLIERLSPEAQDYWKQLRHRRFDRRRSQRSQLLQWISEAMRPRWGPDELEKFFTTELNSEQRERLLNLPAEEMQAQLERMFVERRLGLAGSEGLPGEFGETDGPRRGLPRPPGPPRDFGRRDGPPSRGNRPDRIRPESDREQRPRDNDSRDPRRTRDGTESTPDAPPPGNDSEREHD